MGYNILIVDDVFINRKLMKSVLKNSIENITFFDAEDGFEAMDIISSLNIDLVILDLMLPGKDGYEVLNDIKTNNAYKEIPVIVTTAIDNMESIQKTLELGAMDYFTKPLAMEEIKVILPLKVRNALKYYEQRKLLIQMNEQMKQELKIANIFQSTLIPEFKQFDGIDIYGRYLPCKAIGGDLYDCIQTDGSLWFIIADVTGHGVAAAMVSAMLKAVFNNCIQRYSYPNEVLIDINKTFCAMFGNYNSVVFSAFVGVIRDGSLYYSNAGHPYPILLDTENNEVKMLKQNGLLIGVFEDMAYDCEKAGIKKGDVVFAYTDGLYETGLGEESQNWEAVYYSSLKYIGTAAADPKEFFNAVFSSFYSSNTREFNDDVTMMLIKLK